MPIGQSEQTPAQPEEGNQKKPILERENLSILRVKNLGKRKEYLKRNIGFADKIAGDAQEASEKADETLTTHEDPENQNFLFKRRIRKLKKALSRIENSNIDSLANEEKVDLEKILARANRIDGKELLSQEADADDLEEFFGEALQELVDGDENEDGLEDYLQYLDKELEKIEQDINKWVKKVENFARLSKEQQEFRAKVVITIWVLAIAVGAYLTIDVISRIKDSNVDTSQPQVVETATINETNEEAITVQATETVREEPEFKATIQPGGSVMNAYYNAIGGHENYNSVDWITVKDGDSVITQGSAGSFNAGDLNSQIVQPGYTVEVNTQN